jgi:AhpD family alkylhydroperoxidase
MTVERFAPLALESAPAASRPLLQASHKKLGFLASPVAKAARSPALLGFMLAGFPAFDRSSLAPLEREVVALTVAFHNECHYCMAMHSSLLSQRPENASIVAALRAGAPLEEPRLEAVRLLTREVVERRGRVPLESWSRFEAAGLTEENALDVVFGVGVYTLSTLTNVVVGAITDPPFADFAWQKPTPSREAF